MSTNDFGVFKKFEKYPNLMWAINNSTSGYSAYPEIGEGWYQLVDDLVSELKMYKLDYTVSQIKEKFWGLRFYTDFEDYGILDEEVLKKFNETIAKYENKSYYICDSCGAECLSEEKLSNGVVKRIFACGH